MHVKLLLVSYINVLPWVDVIAFRLLDLQSSDYAVGTRLSSPCGASGSSKQHSPEPQQLKQEQERDNLYGSELIRRSLAVLSTPGKLSTVIQVVNHHKVIQKPLLL